MRSELPPPLELLCLNALWNLREGNVRDVQRLLGRPLAYTTVMTLLDRLARKGVLTRRKVGRAFLYAPQVSRDVVQRPALKEFVEGYFDGSQEQLLAFLQTPAAPPRDPRPEPLPRLDAALL